MKKQRQQGVAHHLRTGPATEWITLKKQPKARKTGSPGFGVMPPGGVVAGIRGSSVGHVLRTQLVLTTQTFFWPERRQVTIRFAPRLQRAGLQEGGGGEGPQPGRPQIPEPERLGGV